MRGKVDAKSHHNGTLSLMLDFGPLLVFFLSYKGAGWIWGASNPITAMTASLFSIFPERVKIPLERWEIPRVNALGAIWEQLRPPSDAWGTTVVHVGRIRSRGCNKTRPVSKAGRGIRSG